MCEFYKEINKKIFNSMNNEYYDNFDFQIRKLSKRVRYKIFLEKHLNKILKQFTNNTNLNILHINYFWKNIEKFEFLYNLLSDENSKKKYIEIIAYKILGFTKVKLSLNNDKFWKIREEAEVYRKKDDSISVNFGKGKLYLYNLKDLNYNLSLYFVQNGIVTDFMLQQYNYNDIVKVEKDDIVVDCGGCWGDTALYFSDMGAKEVYVFEFIPSNIAIMQKNILLNPHYKETIKLVKNPVWDKSYEKLSYLDKGPASLVGDFSQYKHKTATLTIDELVKIKNIQKIDFIKMDIEGAEIPALNGAVETIKKFKPKLAISAYHKTDDLVKIPELINSIRDDYIFYFDYYTIIADEAIIYAI